VLDGSGNSSNLSASLTFTSEPQLSLSFDYDQGYDDGDLVTADGYQEVRVEAHFDLDPGDRVQVLVNGSWEDADYYYGEEEEAPETGGYFYTWVELDGTGVISARVVNAENEVLARTDRTYVIDSYQPSYSAVGATLSLNIASDTGVPGDNMTQMSEAMIDVQLDSLSGLKVGDVIALRDSIGLEGVMLLGMRGHHVITADDLAGNGHFLIAAQLGGLDRWGPLNLRVVVESAGGNHAEEGHYSNAVLQLTLDNTPAALEGVETSAGLDVLYLYFSEELDPGATFTLVKTSDQSAITITPAMYEQDPESGMMMVSLPTPLADGAAYTLHASGILYDLAGNFTLSDPLASFTASLDVPVDVTFGGISLGDSGAADGYTNVAAQSVSGSFSGTLHSSHKIQVSLDNGLNWTDATLSGSNWSLPGATLAEGENELIVRVLKNGSGYNEVYRSVTLDTAAPGLGSAPDLRPAYDTGASNSDNITATASLTVRALLASEDGYRVGDVVDIVNSSNALLGHHTIIASDFDAYGHIGDIDIALDTLAEGAHSLHVRVTDIAGNVISGPALAVTVDSTPPAALLDVGSLTYNDSTGLMGISLSGVTTGAMVEYTLNDSDWQAATSNGGHWEFTTQTGIQQGISLRVTDAAGNLGRGFSGMPFGSAVHIESDWNQTISEMPYRVLFTQGGDDYIRYAVPDDFDYVDAGSGIDTLALSGASTFDAASLAGKVLNVEQLELNGAITMTVAGESTLNALGTLTLRILGSVSAMVDLSSGAWTHATTIGGYGIYTAGNAVLEIAEIVGVDLGTA